MKKLTLTPFFAGLSLLGVVFSFQACGSKVEFQGGVEKSISHLESSNNGEGYAGKLSSYEYTEPLNSCQDIGKSGRPLPNGQILIHSSGVGQLVRKNCADIPPEVLRAQDFTLDPTGNIHFQNQSFVPHNPGDFEVVAADCPAPKNTLSNPLRFSLFPDVLNFLSPNWHYHSGISVSSNGTLASLPLFRIERTDSNLLDQYRRFGSSQNLLAGKLYAFSFFVKRSLSGEKAIYMGSHSNINLMDVEVAFDLNTGAATVFLTNGVNNFSTATTVFADGLLISLYFSPTTSEIYNLGVAPQSSVLGANIEMTAMSLQEVSAFCTP